MRKDPLRNRYIYHICSKSIAGYIIFRSNEDYLRMKEMMGYYSHDGPLLKFSLYKKLLSMGNINIAQDLSDKDHLVDVIAYCIMPTHLHFVYASLRTMEYQYK